MPTYQYACTNPDTKHEFEVVQSFTDAPVSVCPECGAAVRKVYGSVGVVFKGSGFYRTDSRKAEASSSSSTSKDSGSTGSSAPKESSSNGSSGSKDAGSSAPAATPSSSGSAASTGAGKAAK